MRVLFDWMVGIPEYLANFGNWLTTPMSDHLPFTPLEALGASAVVVVSAIVIAKIVHLIIG